MNLDKDTVKKIIFIIAVTIFLLWIALNYQVALDVIGFVLGLLMPLFYGICMAFILNVLMKFYENRLLGKITPHIKEGTVRCKVWSKALRPVSLILTLLSVAGLIYFVSAMIIPSLERTVQLLISQAPQFTSFVKDWVNSILDRVGLDLTIDSVYQIRDIINSYDQDLLKRIVEFISGTGSAFASGVAGFAVGVFSTVANISLGFIFSIYILLTKETLGTQLKNFLAAAFSYNKSKRILEVASLSQHIFERFVAGQCIEAVVIGTLTGLGSLAINSDFALMLGVLVGFTALIPVVGAIVGVVVGALLLVMISPWQALAFIIFILLLQQLENNLIYPRVVGKSIGLPGMWVFFAVLAGGSVYGIVGIIIGVPLVSVLYSLIRLWTRKRLQEKKAREELEPSENGSGTMSLEEADKILESDIVDFSKIDYKKETTTETEDSKDDSESVDK